MEMFLDIPALAMKACAPRVTEGKEFSRAAPTSPDTVAEWNRELARIAPKQDNASYLKMVWVAGDPWNPVQRWMVFDFEPRSINPTGWYWEELDGPDPRTKGYFDKVLGKFLSSEDQAINQLSWQLYRQTGCFARPFWVLQGSKGGHPRWYTQLQERLLRQSGLPTDPPVPGELPYCEPDQRTWEAIAYRDRIYGLGAKYNTLNPQQKAEMEREVNAKLLKWLENQVEDIYKDTRPRNLTEQMRVVHDEPDWVKDSELIDERILSRGTL